MGLRGPCRGVKAGPLPCSAVTASEALWEGAADRPQVAQPGRLEAHELSPCRTHQPVDAGGWCPLPSSGVLGLDRWPGGLLSVREGCLGSGVDSAGARGQGACSAGAACPRRLCIPRAHAWLRSW